MRVREPREFGEVLRAVGLKCRQQGSLGVQPHRPGRGLEPERVLLGLVAGVLSGMFGIGGGIVIVPALVLFFGFEAHRATGTSLGALLLPVGFFGALNYYKAGSVQVGAAAAIAIGLALGAWAGSKLALDLSPRIMQRSFAVFLVFAAYLTWRKS